MTLAAFRPFSILSVAAALVATLSSSHFASAADWNATTCEELASSPAGNMTEDSTLTIRGIILTCDEVTTVEVGGPFMLTVYGEVNIFTNVRFGVTGGAHLFLTGFTWSTTMIFNGITNLASNGGVFNVELGSSATINVPSAIEHNSVQAGYSGGAVYAGGKVNFPKHCTFNDNSVMRDEDTPSGSGGAVFVDHGGAIVFGGVFANFIYNEVGSGGRGGAIANMGSVLFQASSGEVSFTDNTATAYVSSGGEVTGGHGGAIYTGESGVTAISAFRSASHNSAYSGGAMYNSGTTIIFSSPTNEFIPEFADNAANGGDAGNGGHIYTAGVVYAEDACGFTYGTATGNGGAVYIEDAGHFNSAGQVTYTSNNANGECDDMYVSGGHPVCQPSSEAGVGKAVKSK
eukprot:jgi/Undpi1/12861/HiC_scaffold_7.g02528.m1